MQDTVISILNYIISGLGTIITGILSILPASPFSAIDNSSVSEYLGYLNWIIPLDQIIAILEVWLIAIATFYIISIALRWVKAIQ